MINKKEALEQAKEKIIIVHGARVIPFDFFENILDRIYPDDKNQEEIKKAREFIGDALIKKP